MVSKHSYDKIVYLLQGGGALGTYQVGVCKALLEFGCAPDWVVGTSIGAINAAIIVGNKPENRIAKLNAFWERIASPIPLLSFPLDIDLFTELQNFWGAQWGIFCGQSGFFKPRLFNPWFEFSSTPDKLSYYDTSELHATLESVIDFDLINQKKIRLSLGATHIKTGQAVRFDNFRQIIGPEHVMASCALPPGFPAIKIDDEYYWDGGLVSNTPFSAVLEEKIPQKLLCFIVNLFAFPDHIPTTMMEVMRSTKDTRYASHHQEILHYFCELHYLQNAINLASKTIANIHDLDAVLNEITSKGHPTSLNLIRFHYKDCPSDLWSKDFNFSPQALKRHFDSGYKDAQLALKETSWLDFSLDDLSPSVREF